MRARVRERTELDRLRVHDQVTQRLRNVLSRLLPLVVHHSVVDRFGECAHYSLVVSTEKQERQIEEQDTISAHPDTR